MTRADVSHPLVYKKEGIRLIFALLMALRTREKRLPESALHHYLEKISEKREIFLEGALRFGTPQYFYDHPALMDQIARFHHAFSKYLPRFVVEIGGCDPGSKPSPFAPAVPAAPGLPG